MLLLINFEKYSGIHTNYDINLNYPSDIAIIFTHSFTLFHIFKIKIYLIEHSYLSEIV